MKRKFMCWFMAAVAAVACEREEMQSGVTADEMVSLEIKIPAESTRISGSGGMEEDAVSDYQVFVFDMDTRLAEVYATPASGEVTLQCTIGQKEVVVLANAPDLSAILSYDEFLLKRSLLADNSAGHLVMVGHQSTDLTAAVNSLTVHISRIVSKVVLSSLTVDFEQEKYDEMNFVIKEIYLTNVVGDKNYLSGSDVPTIWYNKVTKDLSSPVKSLIHEDVEDINMKGLKDYGRQHCFYCYPNEYVEDDYASAVWTPRPTRLVVEAMLGTELYYYPVSLPELEANNQYQVSLNIVRPGATSPEQDMRKNDAFVNVVVEGWYGPESITERI